MAFHNGFEGGFTYVTKDEMDADVTIDMDITEWSGNEQCPSRNVTTTGDYDPETGRSFVRRHPGQHSFNGSLSFPVDVDTIDWQSMRSGVMLKQVTLIAVTGQEIYFPELYIPENQASPGGQEDVFRFTLPFESSGVYYWFGETAPVEP